MTFLPVHDFVTSFGHLENIRSLNYTDLSYIDTIHYIILKIKFIIIIKKSFKYWELDDSAYKFPKIPIFI